MNSKLKILLIFIVAALAGTGAMQLLQKVTGKRMPTTEEISNFNNPRFENTPQNIAKLTSTQLVVAFVKEHQRLPQYYITKNEARKLGWEPSEGNLCKALPGKAIGGDRFGNREGKLPKKQGRRYFEADLNYDCGRRGDDRLVFSNDGLIFVTTNHYKTFEQQ